MSLPTLDNNDENKRNNMLSNVDMPSLDDDNANSMPSLDDEFEEISVKEALYEEGDEKLNEEIYAKVEEEEDVIENELPDIKKEEKEALATEDDYYPEFEEDDNADKDKFIDKKNKKLIPFGGNKSKSKKNSKKFVKSSDFDDRKNKLAKTKVIQFTVLSIIVLMFFIGLKNTFMPSHIYTSDQIKQFAKEGAGQTDFPNERGKTFVENFMTAYLTFDRTKPELFQMLGYYYGEEQFGNSEYGVLNVDWSSDSKQSIVIPPKVLEVNQLSDYSSQYTVTSYVTNIDGKYNKGDELTGRWLTFSVNVYYDKETNSLAITGDSPIIVPEKKISKQDIIPERRHLGNGEINRDIIPAITPTVDGFIEAYAKSSLESHNAILQYIKDKDDINLHDGFGESVKLQDTPENSIEKVVYDTDIDGVYEVDVTVTWVDTLAVSGENSVEYIARYQMTVETSSDGKFVVDKFHPYTYFKE